VFISFVGDAELLSWLSLLKINLVQNFL